jgi:hypothetical protein
VIAVTARRDSWLDREAGPVVRPYFVTKGRTLPGDRTPIGLIDIVAATGARPPDGFRPGPEHRQILSRCQQPVTVVDLASDAKIHPAAAVFSGWRVTSYPIWRSWSMARCLVLSGLRRV